MSGTISHRPWWARARGKEIRYEASHWCADHDVECDLPEQPGPRHRGYTRCQWWPDHSDQRVWGGYRRSKSEQVEARQDRRRERHTGGRTSVSEGVSDFFDDLVDDLFD